MPLKETAFTPTKDGFVPRKDLEEAAYITSSEHMEGLTDEELQYLQLAFGSEYMHRQKEDPEIQKTSAKRVNLYTPYLQIAAQTLQATRLDRTDPLFIELFQQYKNYLYLVHPDLGYYMVSAVIANRKGDDPYHNARQRFLTQNNPPPDEAVIN